MKRCLQRDALALRERASDRPAIPGSRYLPRLACALAKFLKEENLTQRRKDRQEEKNVTSGLISAFLGLFLAIFAPLREALLPQSWQKSPAPRDFPLLPGRMASPRSIPLFLRHSLSMSYPKVNRLKDVAALRERLAELG